MNKIRVVEFQGLAPSVFLGMYLADQGADVIFVARKKPAEVSMPFQQNILNRNKKCIVADFKNQKDFALIAQLIKTADVVIDPYRPGVLEKLKLGPKDLQSLNSRIILLRVSGYGQTGDNRLRPGHDANYLAVGGIFTLLNGKGEYQFPMNYMADFVAASLGITGVLAALREREKTGRGAVVDASLADGCTYLAQNMIDSSADNQKFEVKTYKIGNSEYIASGANCQLLAQKQIVEWLGEKNYHKSAEGLQISRVLQTESIENNTLGNPFSVLKLSNRIRNKGENTQEIVGQFLPKL